MNLNVNAEVIFMLCSHLLPVTEVKPYEPAEWSKLAERLMEAGMQPSDLPELLNADFRDLNFDSMEIQRIQQLLGHGGSLSFELEKYESMGISVITRVDALYPKMMKARLGKNCPPLFYYAGDLQLANIRCVGFVGARSADEKDQQFTEKMTARINALGHAVVSGGAKALILLLHQLQ